MKTEANTPEELLPPAGDIQRRFTPNSLSNAQCCVTERLTALVALLNDCLTLEQEYQAEGGTLEHSHPQLFRLGLHVTRAYRSTELFTAY